ncbi:Nucleolar protein 16 [Yarrowia sp. C11]|nr:Nucleolar protein 16 [Yarrowia sp. E02]KAG5372575.1 Nucleolar protein 16 [Yarrowia sp. C11]
MPSGVRRRKMNRSSITKVTRKDKDNHKRIVVTGSDIIRQRWDKNLSMAQNYKKLGLATKTGSKKVRGLEENLREKSLRLTIQQGKNPHDQELRDLMEQQEREALEKNSIVVNERKIPKLGAGEAFIVRDDKGEVVEVIYGKDHQADSDEEDDEEWTGFEDKPEEEETETIKILQERAERAASNPHVQSDREQSWIEQLINKHGDDIDGMFWDKELNIYQQSRGDLKRRIKKWKQGNKRNQ